ncbi:hypothetical protein NC652_025697 [Populus alba x Populus x berolinensis]|uniref:Uncharacterized protein n=2 Tax=Populus TaxID=3689 RepID=A0A8X7Z3T0_POPTO|nr:hypothetical protein POTOM_036117 [Populus tomentosa]KAJ6899297.1 hypothetical protein NC652_025697 [Populus alba x Populus x berolinensis]
MNHCAIQQNAFSTRDEIRSSVSVPVSDRRDPVVCPKPRRFGLLNNHPARSIRFQLSHQSELCDSKAGNEFLDIILTKGGYGVDNQSFCKQVASSPPPFFCGSPPSRVANPLIQDARFGDEKFTPLSPVTPIPPTMDLSSSSSSPRKGGLVRANFGNKPVVRIEGFDCLDRDRRNCSIPALA